MDVSEAIRTKRAIREFSDSQLPEKEIRSILESGRRSQSSKNTQPWHFVAIQNKDTLQRLSELGTWAGHLANAALGVAILTPNPEERFQVLFDAGQAAAYMQLAAWELGIGSCLASIYEPDEARKLLGFPSDLHLRIAISFGYPLSKEVIVRPPAKGGRKPFEEIVHWDHW